MERYFFSWNETIHVSLHSDRHYKKTGLGVLDHQPVLEHQPVAEGVFFQQYYVAESIPTYSHFNGNSKYDPNDPQRDRLVQKPLGSSVLPLRSRERLPGLGSQFSDIPETNIYEIKLRRLGLQTLTCSIFLVLFKKKARFHWRRQVFTKSYYSWGRTRCYWCRCPWKTWRIHLDLFSSIGDIQIS